MPLPATIQAADENLRVAMACYSRATDTGELRTFPGITISSSGIDFAVFNSAMLTTPLDGESSQLESLIAIAGMHYAARQLGWSFWLCDDLLCPRIRKKAAGIFAAHDMWGIAEPPGMYTESLKPPRH
ncbi:MAG: hypothetical protein ACRD7E_18115, partial [Bryobacteraceae bacterium]